MEGSRSKLGMQRLSRILGAVFFLVFIVLLLFTDTRRVAHILSSLVWPYVMAYAALTVAFFLARAWRWRVLLDLPDFPKISGTTLFWMTMVGYAFNALIPIRIGGDILRGLLVGRRFKVSLPASLASVVLERVLDIVVISLGGIIALLTIKAEHDMIFPVVTAAGLVVVAVIAFKWVVGRGLIVKTLSRLSWTFPGSVKLNMGENMSLLADYLGRMFRTKPIESSAITLIIWGLHILSTLAVMEAFTHVTSISSIIAGSLIFQLLVLIPSAPGQVGSYELFWVSAFLLSGMTDVDMLLSSAVVTHVFSYVLVLGIGALAALKLGLDPRIPRLRETLSRST